MAILIDSQTRLVVQGLTGREGRFHALRNRDYGTQVVAGVTPGKPGQDVGGIPVFNPVATAVAETAANTSLIFVPARFAVDALYEAADAGIGVVVLVTENIPVLDMTSEIGGDEEERAARFVSEGMDKPVVAYIAGFEAPPGKRMGHAGAIISGSSGTAQAKADALEAAGVRVGRNPTEAAELAVAAVSPTGPNGPVGVR